MPEIVSISKALGRIPSTLNVKKSQYSAVEIFRICLVLLAFFIAATASAQVTNTLEAISLTTNAVASAPATNSPVPLTLPPLPAAGPSIIRVIGALALVLGIFFGGVWLY